MPAPPTTVPVYYDFASTLSYVAHRVLGRLADRLASTGLTFAWRPVDLAAIAGWSRGAPIDALQRERVVGIGRALVGPIHVPRTWPDSRRLAAVALALGGSPLEPAWRERVWTGIYDQGDDPSDRNTVGRWERDLGIDVADADGDFDTLHHATDAARHVGVRAVPTLLLGEWPMAGIQDDASMLALLTRWAARQR